MVNLKLIISSEISSKSEDEIRFTILEIFLLFIIITLSQLSI